ncbi:MAG: hypothetical protein FH748_14320 [Balneolaceae bacterium]|nr:hypothetical protein [Balneolaceae bacterium]
MNRIYCSLLIFLMTPFYSSFGQDEHHHAKHEVQVNSQQYETIKSLSQQDIQELLQGKGRGYAKAAELNGMPGPRHVLDMEDQIKLNDDQKKQIELLFDEMEQDASVLGAQLITREKSLNKAFATQQVNEEKLKQLLQDIAQTTAELRYTHLYTHLKTADILSDDQIDIYNRLRKHKNEDKVHQALQKPDSESCKKHKDH